MIEQNGNGKRKEEEEGNYKQSKGNERKSE